MDYESALKQDALRIAEAIHQFAKRKKWRNYLLFIRANTTWNTIHVGITSDHFKTDEFDQVDDKYYIELLDYLRDELRDQPGLYQSLGLNLFTMDDSDGLSTLYFPILGSDEIEIGFNLLNPGIKDPRPQFLAEYGSER